MKKEIDQYLGLQKQIDRLHAKHAAVFRALTKLEDEQAAITDKIKELARKRSVAGQTIQAFSSEEIEVTVVGRLGPPTYDLALARRVWPEAAVDAALVETLDSELVESMVKTGSLPESMAGRALLPREQKTPAVTIKLKEAKRAVTSGDAS